MSSTPAKCLVTGSGGYLGGSIKQELGRRGILVGEMSRSAKKDGPVISFNLGDSVDKSVFENVKMLVHCAYDFRAATWDQIERRNIRGSEKLFSAARDGGVERIVYVSSIAAFTGCRALYGKAKLATEEIARTFGAVIIRPGLVWGDPPGSAFARLIKQVSHSWLLPVPGGDAVHVSLVHIDDLLRVVTDCLLKPTGALPDAPITVASEQQPTLRRVLEEIARSQGKQISCLNIPWQPLWLAIKAAETAGVRLDFRSDSLLSLVNYNCNPDFEPLHRLGINCRPFKLT